MNAIETLKAIKKTIALAFAAPAPDPTPAPPPAPEPVVPDPMKEYDLADGSKIKLDKLEIGGSVVTVDSTGAEAPAPDAEYNLADGTSLTVVGGLITEVSGPEPAVEPDVTTPQGMSAAIQKFADSPTPDIAKMAIILKAIFENVYGWEIRRAQEEAVKNQAIEIYKTGFEEHKKVTGESFTQIIGLFETLIKTPSVPPIETPKHFAGAVEKQERFAAAAQALEIFKNNKNK